MQRINCRIVKDDNFSIGRNIKTQDELIAFINEYVKIRNLHNDENEAYKFEIIIERHGD